jgi:FKBP-type peptidyl-prolyl cis-trans isomerase 2
MTFKEKDFIEIEFTGRLEDGSVFDSNIKENMEKAKLNGKAESFVFCLGEGMFVKGADKFLIGKDVGEYTIPLTPEEAFGKRDAKLVRMMPMKAFIEHKINPVPGTVLNFDGKMGKILTASGGRVMIDFNNPIAGKNVEYTVKVLRKVDEQKEQIDALNDFFYRKKFDFEVKEGKLIMETPKEIKSFVELFKDKYKEIFGLDVETVEIEEKKKE